ncbi:MAG: ABC transporter substrate-binding protein [Nocardiopsaceae bacterium]|nr:ABC transporter substrate-binding protein [Nocardiopsaceae bacterium]
MRFNAPFTLGRAVRTRGAIRRIPRERLTTRSHRPLRARVAVGAGLCLALAGGLTSASLTSASLTSAAADDTTTLKVVADTSISTFNPFLSYFNGELAVLGNIYPALTTINEKGQPAPYLAKSWKTSPDQLTWTFKIRSGLKWSDGKPLTAADAAWTLNLIMKNPVAGTANGSLVTDFASVTAPNATTLVITTKKPQANMLYVSVPISGIPIVPEHIWSKEVANLGKFKNMDFPVVGYGPWILTGYVPNQYTTLKANPNFFMGPPKFDKLIMQYFTNSDAAVAALRSGQLDEIDSVTSTEYKALASDKKIARYAQASNGWTGIELNPGAKTRTGRHFGTGNPALADPRVRTAIALAINRKELVTKILDGLGVVGAGYIPPGYPQWTWTPSASGALNYDPARANKLLDSAGYKKGANGIRIDPKNHKPLALRLGIHSDEVTDAQMAPYISEWLQAIGIKVDVQSMSFNTLNAELPKGNWDMLSDAWTTGPDPTYLLSIQTCGTLPLNNGTGGNTDAFFCDPQFDKLFAKQATQFTPADRVQTVAQMQQILYNANVDIMLYYANGLSALRTDQVKHFFYGKANAQGFYPQQNLFINWRTATPVGGNSGGSGSTVLIVIIVLVVLLLAGGGVYLRQRATAGERE